MSSYRIESWIGKNDVWYANAWMGEATDLLVRGRGGTREEAIAEVEGHIAERLALWAKTADSHQAHQVEIIPEGAGVRVLEEKGDDET